VTISGRSTLSTAERAEHAAFGERSIYMPDHGTKSYAGKDDVIDAIQTGILSRKVVRYRYAGARGRSGDGHLAPYAMILYRHGLYVVGARLKAAGDGVRTAPTRMFAIERFATAEHLRAHAFEIPADLNLRKLLARGFGPHIGDSDGVLHEVVIEFSRERAVYVSSREWHPTQQLQELPNGRLRLTFTCADVAPVVSWILEWGPHARVVAPERLVESVKRELEEARAQY
jgi:proteasome accessory factor B